MHSISMTDRRTDGQTDGPTDTGAFFVGAGEPHVTITAISARVVDTLTVRTEVRVD